jgi:AcrR family transcriptional regulator
MNLMATRKRTDALSKERITSAAIEILDTDGEAALTFRSLATRLETGAGAIYHHVANKDELLATAADDVIARGVAVERSEPRDTVRAVALGVFDAIDAHPWVGTQLSRQPWQMAIMRIFEGIGGQLGALGVPEKDRFDSATALLSYILGLAAQYAAGARLLARETNRSDFLATIAEQWTHTDPAEYPFVHHVSTQLTDHDDRAQFLAGIDIILNGITGGR